MRRSLTAAGGVVVLLLAGAGALSLGDADAVQAPHDRAVNVVPATATPHVAAGVVKSFAQVGGKIIVGGKFTTIKQTRYGALVSRSNIFAFDAATGKIDTGFAPAVDDRVDALLPGPDGTSVYIGGLFNNVNGVKIQKLARLDTTTGATVAAFKAPFINGPVNDLAISGGRLFVGGQFSKVAWATHNGMATLNPDTGVIDPYMNVQFTGHHNYTGLPGQAFSTPGVYRFDITPDGSRLIAVGNFKTVDGLDRDQVAMLTLGATAAVNGNWHTDRYDAACFANAFDAYVRDVSFSPDGSYFAIASTGGPGAGTLCDAATRWETAAFGTGLQPTWVTHTGGDTLWAVAATGSAVYIGGHQRWVNNPAGWDSATGGAVPRPGVAALDPVNGLPLSWNPGRNPRGAGTYALFPTPSGLYVGSDTPWIGNKQYYRGRLALFPLAGGKATPSTATAALPANIYQAGKLSCAAATCASNTVQVNSYNGTTFGPNATIPDGTFPWSAVRGAVLINGTLYHGWSDGNLYRRSFDGSAFGPPALIDPYNDPYWSNILTSSGPAGQTYRGMKPAFYGQEIQSISSMFYSRGRLYYTFVGQPGMYYRYFTPESGVVGGERFQVIDGLDWSNAGGIFLSGNTLYLAARSNGHLYRLNFTNGVTTGPAVLVSGPTVDGRDWRANAMFLR